MNQNIKRIHICDQPHNHWWEYIYNRYYQGSQHNSKHMFDIYSLTHIFWPMLFTFIGKKIFGKKLWIPGIIFFISILFEIHENLPEQIVKYHRIEIDSMGESSYRGDSTINVIGDIIFNLIGVYLGYTIDSSLIFFIFMLIIIVIVNSVLGFGCFIDFLNYIIDI